mmetsp:Transcript_19556/g.54594  ORF Transcript_19556/g.54594 Transcript_19556/m.54594 type:complete len:260 (-) Transcript_19556:1593-2372(-)
MEGARMTTKTTTYSAAATATITIDSTIHTSPLVFATTGNNNTNSNSNSNPNPPTRTRTRTVLGCPPSFPATTGSTAFAARRWSTGTTTTLPTKDSSFRSTRRTPHASSSPVSPTASRSGTVTTTSFPRVLAESLRRSGDRSRPTTPRLRRTDGPSLPTSSAGPTTSRRDTTWSGGGPICCRGAPTRPPGSRSGPGSWRERMRPRLPDLARPGPRRQPRMPPRRRPRPGRRPRPPLLGSAPKRSGLPSTRRPTKSCTCRA